MAQLPLRGPVVACGGALTKALRPGLPPSPSNVEHQSSLLAKRLKILGIVEKAQDLLECRLNRRSNSMLISSLSSASTLVNSHGITSLFGDESKVFLPSIEKLEGTEHPLLAYVR